MALEAGELMHKMFAAVRIWQLEHVMNMPMQAKAVKDRIFGLKQWKKFQARIDSEADTRDGLLELSFAVLNCSGWVDDPGDNNRTLANMEAATIVYVDERLPHMENWPIYVEDKGDPDCIVGIEQVFDVVLTYSDGYKLRYIGTVDGLVIKAATREYFIDENKTANRIDAGWRAMFDIGHQPTGYCAASSTVFGFAVDKIRVAGLKLKPTYRGEDYYPLEVSRTSDNIRQWAQWARDRAEVYERYKDHYEIAPRFTHSCNRYFRPCSLLSFCGDTVEGRREQWSQMVSSDRSPSERAIMELF